MPLYAGLHTPVTAPARPHRVIVVGGGAGGLELVTKLGRRFGKRGLAEVVLVDRNFAHLWKPLLHEVAAGTLNSNDDELNYLGHAHWNHFRFRLGALEALDRGNRIITVAPSLDEHGVEFIPRRTFAYDTLIIAVGSVTNDFGVPGVAQHCMSLDSREQADHFHRHVLQTCYTANSQKEPPREGQLHIAIAGAGATGVELAAELKDSLHELVGYGLDHIAPERDIKINLIEGADRVLPGLPPRVSEATTSVLRQIGVKVYTGERISEATADGFHTTSGLFIPAATKVWAAGIQAPPVLAQLDGLECNSINQLLVDRSLRTTRDEHIFAFGDCAACPIDESGRSVPPRAQAAHQQASLLAKSIAIRIEGGREFPRYSYRDYGSLINLSDRSTVGKLMGNLLGRASGSLFVEGLLARLAYLSLYKMHQAAVQGWIRTGLLTAANLLTRRAKPRLKLH